ncbi:MAG: shikimate dehydrogenase [Candidatus Methylumidiphilus sp.]
MPQDRYAVFGHPINHSKSPRIHALFAQQTGQAIHYTAQDVPAENFREELKRFAAEGGRGLSCTVPLKELAWGIADGKSVRADRAKAVNTLVLGKDGRLFGDNTDGVGLLRDLTVNLGLTVTGLNILLLGAGGASRGILEPLLAMKPRRMIIANRTVAKAEQLAMEFADLGSIKALPFKALASESFDLILNATAASLSGDLPPVPEGILAAGGTCYDLAYGSQPTAFVRWGGGMGAELSVDGIGMLVEQAAEAFFIWRGMRPQTRPVIELLNAERSQAE